MMIRNSDNESDKLPVRTTTKRSVDAQKPNKHRAFCQQLAGFLDLKISKISSILHTKPHLLLTLNICENVTHFLFLDAPADSALLCSLENVRVQQR